MPQQPTVDDWEDVDDWQDTTPAAPTTPQSFQVPAGVEQPGMLSRAWHAMADPLTDAPSRFARSIGDWMEAPSLATAPTGEGGIGDYLKERYAMAKGFGAGALQGIGDLVSGLSSPLNLATTVATGGASTAAKAGLPQVARGLSLGAKALSAPVILHGASNVLSPESTMAERGQGLVEMAGGGAAMLHTPTSGKPGPATLETPSVKAGSEPLAAPTKGVPAPKGPSAPVKGAASEVAPGIVDKFAAERKIPIGTKFTVSPENMKGKVRDALKLGFDITLDDNGKMVVTKVRESPPVNLPETPEQAASLTAEVMNLPRTLMASIDMSAPMRQGLGLIHKKEFWKALPDMVKAFGSEETYRALQDSITDNPMFKKTVNARGQVQPSFAEKAGLQLTDLKNMGTREESMMSNLAEKIPGMGRYVRASNRAYTIFLNKLRADTFSAMVKDYGAYSGMDVKNNIHLASQIADYVNAASGRGKLSATIGGKTYSAEPAAKILSTVFFSPRLMASRLGMMGKAGQAVFSPEVYMLQSPSVRREYLKSLASIAAVAGTFISLGKMAGATVESDPASSDFGKVKFGDTRIDPYGGFQQYIVLMQRLMPHIDLSEQGLDFNMGGRMKSTTTDEVYSLSDPAFGRSNRADVTLRFLRSKTNPLINFAWGMMAGTKELSGKPMNFTAVNPIGEKGENIMDNAIFQRFAPMITQDIYDLYMNETTPPQAKALAAFLASVGMGSQTYGPND